MEIQSQQKTEVVTEKNEKVTLSWFKWKKLFTRCKSNPANWEMHHKTGSIKIFRWKNEKKKKKQKQTNTNEEARIKRGWNKAALSQVS